MLGDYAVSTTGAWRCCSTDCAIETGLTPQRREIAETPGCEHCLNCGLRIADTPCAVHDTDGIPPGFACPDYRAEATKLFTIAARACIRQLGDLDDEVWEQLRRYVARNPHASGASIARAIIKRTTS